MGLLTGIVRAFKNGFNTFKHVFHNGRNLIRKFSPTIKNIFQTTKKYVPKAIDTIKKYSPAVFDTTNKIIDMLPDSKAKDKLKNLSDGGERVVHRGTDIADRFNNLIQKVPLAAKIVPPVKTIGPNDAQPTNPNVFSSKVDSRF